MASAGQRYSNFEVVSDREVTGVTGRRRLNHSPDLRELHKPREAVRLRFKKTAGSQARPSKVC